MAAGLRNVLSSLPESSLMSDKSRNLPDGVSYLSWGANETVHLVKDVSSGFHAVGYALCDLSALRRRGNLVPSCGRTSPGRARYVGTPSTRPLLRFVGRAGTRETLCARYIFARESYLLHFTCLRFGTCRNICPVSGWIPAVLSALSSRSTTLSLGLRVD